MKSGVEQDRVVAILQALHRAAVVGFVASMPVSIAACQISLGLAWIFWLSLGIKEKKWLGFRTSLDIWFLIFLISAVVSSLLSPRPIESLVGLKKFYLLSVTYLVAFSVKEENRFNELLFIFIFMTALAGLYGIVLYLIQGGGKLIATQSMAMTSGGIFMLATLLVIPLPVRLKKMGPALKIGAKAMMAAILLTALILTKTVSSWLGFVSGLVAVGSRKSKYVLLLGLIAVVAISVLVMSRSNIDFLAYDKSESLRVRMIMWVTAWKMFRERPLWGWGLIDLAQEAKKYRTPGDLSTRGYVDFGHMHNNFVHIAVIMGVFGLTAFCALWVAVLRQQLKEEQRSGIDKKMLVRTLGGAVIAFLINGLAEWNFGDSEVITIVWFLVGLLLSAQHYGYLSSNLRKS